MGASARPCQGGGFTGRDLPGREESDPDLRGALAVGLIAQDARPFPAQAFAKAFQGEARALPLTEQLSFQSWRWGGSGAHIEIDLFGAELRVRKAASEALKARLAQYGETSAAMEDSLLYGKEDVLVELTATGQALRRRIW